MGRMSAPPAANPYEVNCTHCRVSFPVGTRTCIHCGNPIGRPAAPTAALLRGGAGDEESADELPLHGARVSPLTLLWLLAGVATVAYRACAS